MSNVVDMNGQPVEVGDPQPVVIRVILPDLPPPSPAPSPIWAILTLMSLGVIVGTLLAI